MEIVVEERNNPENFEKFFDVEAIERVAHYEENGGYEAGFGIRSDISHHIIKTFPEWKYRVAMV